MRPHSNQPVFVVCSENQISVHFELGSGASVSTISEFQARKLNANIHPTNSRIVAYDGNPVIIFGRTNSDAQYKNITVSHSFSAIVVAGNKNIHLGSNIFAKLNISINLPDDQVSNISNDSFCMNLPITLARILNRMLQVRSI